MQGARNQQRRDTIDSAHANIIPAEVNPALLAWAREESGYSAEVVPKRLGIKLERLEAWERGERKPTVRQTQQLARHYRRPFGVFFLPQPPSMPPLAAEYRRLPGVRPGIESPEFRLALRTMLQRREIALQLSEELGFLVPEFRTAAHLSDGAIAVGTRVREVLGVTVERQLAWRDEWQAWREGLQRAGASIEARYPDLMDPKSPYQSADAYVIGLAQLRGGVVRPPKEHYIPDVCRELGVPRRTLHQPAWTDATREVGLLRESWVGNRWPVAKHVAAVNSR